MRVALELCYQVIRRDVSGNAGEELVKGRYQLSIRACFKLGEQIDRSKQRTHERLVQIGKSDKHETAGRPNMQMIRRDGKVPGLGRRHGELAPKTVDILLMIVHPGELHHVVPGGGVGSICSDEEIKRHLDLSVAIGWGDVGHVHDFEPCLLLPEVRACQLMLKEELDIG